MKTTIFFSLVFLSLLFGKEVIAQPLQTDDFIPSGKFIENKGQIADFDGNIHNEIQYYIKSQNLQVYFKKDRISFYLVKGNPKYQNQQSFKTQEEQRAFIKKFKQDSTYYFRYDMVLENGNPNCRVSGKEKSTFSTNYYYPHCPNGITDVGNFSSIIYHNIYKDIDIRFSFTGGKLKYDIIVNSGGDLNNVKIRYDGINDLLVSSNSVSFTTPLGEINEHIPASYYLNKNGDKSFTEVSYSIQENILCFETEKQDNKQTFIIDPEISWSTYYMDRGYGDLAADADSRGNQFVLFTASSDQTFPVLNPGGGAYFQNTYAGGSGDFKILKFNTDGVRIWATYYGGSDYEATGGGVRIDGDGNIWAVGITESNDIPTQNAGGYYDATWTAGTYNDLACFMMKFDSSGVRQWASHYDYVWASGLDVDANNHFFVIGNVQYDTPSTHSLSGAYNQSSITQYSAGNNSSDGFIMEFNPNTSLRWATIFGAGADEDINYIDAGADGYVNIVSSVDSYHSSAVVLHDAGGYYDNTVNARMDILISRFNTSRALVWSTLFGGSDNESNSPWGNVIQSDGNNNIFVTSSTRSSDLTTVNPGGGAYYDGTLDNTENIFLLKFNSATNLLWSTYLGTAISGSLSSSMRVNSNNRLIFITTASNNSFPQVSRTGDYNHAYNSSNDIYIAEFNENLGIDWSTYVGSSASDWLGGFSLLDDACGYDIFFSGRGWGTSGYPLVNPGGGVFYCDTNDTYSFITKMGHLSATAPTSVSTTANNVCSGNPVTLSVVGGNPSNGTWTWYEGGCGNGSPIDTGTNITVYPLTTTIYYVRAEGPCDTTACVSITINVSQITLDTVVTNATCGANNGAVSVTPQGGTAPYDFLWSTSDTTSSLSGLSPGSYSVTVTDQGGCSDSITLTVADNGGMLSVDISDYQNVLCYGDSSGYAMVSATGAGGNYTYQWSNGDTDSLAENLSAGTYYVTVSEGECVGTDSITINEPTQLAYDYEQDSVSCYGYSDGSITLNITGGIPSYSYTWSPSGYTQNDSVYSGLPEGSYAVTITDANGCSIAIPKIEVRQPNALSTQITATDASCYGTSDGTATITATGGTQPYAYAWTGGFTGYQATNLNAGTYFVTITDNNNCQTVDTAVIASPSAIAVSEVMTSPSCIDNNDGSIAVTATGGQSPYIYLWNNRDTDSLAEELTAGTYYLTLTDNNDCETIKTYELPDGTETCLKIPDIFTPNGDGTNDTWIIEGIDLYPDATVEIYNRWGDLIFKSTGYTEPWDGTWHGKELPISSFIYIINLNNGTDPIQGIVTIKR